MTQTRHAGSGPSRERGCRLAALVLVLAGASLTDAGCCVSREVRQTACDAALTDIPTEMQKVSIPPYRVEPPDILSIEAVNNIRPASDPLRAGDELIIRASNTLPIDPQGDPVQNEFKQINGPFRVQTDGTVDLGPEYGSVFVDGLTLKEARAAIDRHLREEQGLAEPKVAVSLPNVNGKQLISGEHLIRPDGTIQLGVYGNVYVSGMTLEEVKQVVEEHLSHHIHRPEVAVDVLAYNSKVVYIISDGGGSGESVTRVPFTGNETVLDAFGQINGLPAVSSKKNIWIARRGDEGSNRQLPVDWCGISQRGDPSTNYQIMPGDRLYVKADKWITFDNGLGKRLAPIERVFGATLLGSQTVNSIRNRNTGTGSSGF